MSRALLQLQRDFESSEETSAEDGTPATFDDDDMEAIGVVQAGLRAELDAVATAKQHVCSLRRISDQGVEARTAELRAVGLHGVLDPGSLSSAAASPAAEPSRPASSVSVLKSHGLIDAGARWRL